MKKKYITYFGNPNEFLKSQYGRITFGDWCKLEAVRIGQGAFVETDDKGRVAICKP